MKVGRKHIVRAAIGLVVLVAVGLLVAVLAIDQIVKAAIEYAERERAEAERVQAEAAMREAAAKERLADAAERVAANPPKPQHITQKIIVVPYDPEEPKVDLN